GLKFVYVLDKDNKAWPRQVDVGKLTDDGRRVIKPLRTEKRQRGKDEVIGLRPADRVVVTGLQRIRRGTQVKPKLVPMPRSRPRRPRPARPRKDPGRGLKDKPRER